MLVQVTTLYGYTNEGEWLNNGFITSGLWKIVQELMKKCLKESEDSMVTEISFKVYVINFVNQLESKLRYSLSCCIYLYQHWSPLSSSPLVLCWEYFHRNLVSY